MQKLQRLSPTLRSRYDQMFPSLTQQEIERLRRFGAIRHYRDGEALFKTGDVRGMFIIIGGHVTITQRDGLGHVTPVADQGPGQFLAEVGTLSGRPALVDGHAEGDVEALVIAPEDLRKLLVAEAELGERIVRALILRRVGLIETGASGPVLIGSHTSPDIVRLQTFLRRNGQPYHVLDPESDPEACELVVKHWPVGADLPYGISTVWLRAISTASVTTLRSRGARPERFHTSSRRRSCVYLSSAGATIRTSSRVNIDFDLPWRLSPALEPMKQSERAT